MKRTIGMTATSCVVNQHGTTGRTMTMEKKEFSGSLARGGEDGFSIRFSAWADENERLRIEVEPVEISIIMSLQNALGEPGSLSEFLELRGVNARGETFFSSSASLRGLNFGTNGSLLKVDVSRGTVVTACVPPCPRPSSRLYFRGFKSFYPGRIESKLGMVDVAGNPHRGSRDETSGWVNVQADEGTDLADWPAKADEFLTFLHRGLAFAHGGRLQTPRHDLIVGERWQVTYYGGEGLAASLAPIHFMNQRPFIEALVKRHEQEPMVPEMLWTAIGWLHMDIPSHEARFLVSMTALETIVEHLLPKTLTTIMPKDKFATVRSRLVEALDGPELDATTREILTSKIKGLNGRALSLKIQGVRDHYSLPGEIFTDDLIVDVIKTRNNIVHSGTGGVAHSIWPKVVFVRELITQIAFQEIGYRGPYESYLSGHQTVNPNDLSSVDNGLVGATDATVDT